MTASSDERQLVELLRSAVPDLAGVSFEDVARRARRRQLRQGLIAAVAAAAIVAAVVVVTAGLSRPGSVRRTPVTVTPPAGQHVSMHGLEITVPASWKLDDAVCGSPVHDTVMLLDGRAVAACYFGVSDAPLLTVVHIGAYTYYRTVVQAVALHRAVLNGQDVRIGSIAATPESAAGTMVYVPSVGAVLDVRGPDPALRAQILRSLRVVRTDSAGCQTRINDIRSPTSSHVGAAHALVPDEPTHAVVCDYVLNWIDTSRSLNATATNTLAELLNQLPHRAVAQSRRCVLRYNGTVVRFTYADGPPVQVTLQFGDCPSLVASNGTLVVALRDLKLLRQVPLRQLDRLILPIR